MPKLVLCPGKQKHVEKTIFESVSVERVRPLVSPEELRDIEVDSVAREFRIWAADDNDWAPSQWRKLVRGDVVIFYYDKYFRAWGRVGSKFKNQKVGPELWPDPESNGFPYLYVIRGGGALEIPSDAVNARAHFSTDAVLRKITVLEEQDLRNLQGDFGTIEEALAALSETPLIPFHSERPTDSVAGRSSTPPVRPGPWTAPLRRPTELPSERVRSLIEREEQQALQLPEFVPTSLEDARRHVLRSVVEREGQPQFRRRLLDAYGGRCAITNCGTVEVLAAAHIVPYKGPDFNHVSNGLLLRTDLHTLLDRRLVTIDPKSMTVEIDPKLDDSEYASLAGKRVRLPSDENSWPSTEALNQHRSGRDLERTER